MDKGALIEVKTLLECIATELGHPRMEGREHEEMDLGILWADQALTRLNELIAAVPNGLDEAFDPDTYKFSNVQEKQILISEAAKLLSEAIQDINNPTNHVREERV